MHDKGDKALSLHHAINPTFPESPASSDEVDPPERWQEAASLAGQIDRVAVHKLLDYLSDGHPFVRHQAGMSLAETAERLRKRARLGLPVWDRQAPELSFSGLLMLVRQGLQDPNPTRRAATADSFALWDHEVVVTFLIKALEDPEPAVRASVATALGKIRDKAAVGVLKTALTDSSLWVRRAAADALGAIADPQAVPALQQALTDPQPLMRATLVCALGHIHTNKSREVLEQCTRDDDPAIRWYAARGLREIGTSSSLPALQRLLADDGLFFGQPTREVATAAVVAIRKREKGFLNWMRRHFYALWHGRK
jgi:HEAT repeat protein